MEVLGREMKMPFLWGWLRPLIIASLVCEQSYQGKGTPSLQIPSGIMSHMEAICMSVES